MKLTSDTTKTKKRSTGKRPAPSAVHVESRSTGRFIKPASTSETGRSAIRLIPSGGYLVVKKEKPRTLVTKRLDEWIVKIGKKGVGIVPLHGAIMHGIGIAVADALKNDLNINDRQMAEALGTSESTLLRLRKAHKDLDEVASDRLVRYARILEIATEVFEDKQKAQSWLKRPQFGLGDKVPLELMKSEMGAREVENLLMRIEHGVLA